MIATVVMTTLILLYGFRVLYKGLKSTQRALKGLGCSGCQYEKKSIVQIEFK